MQKYLGGYLMCKEHNQPISLVCLEESCEKKGIICCYCQYKSHKHPVRALTSLFIEIQKDIKTYEQCLILLAQMDNIFIEIEQEVKKIQSRENRKILGEMVGNYYKYNVDKFFKRSKLISMFIRKKQKEQKQINQFIQQYNFDTKQCKGRQYSNCEYEIKINIEQLKKIIINLKQLIKKNEIIDKIYMLFTIQNDKKVKYYFNVQKSHKDFVISNKTKVQLKDGFLYRIALVDPPINKQNAKHKKQICLFKIIKISAMIGIGIAYKNKSQASNYLFVAHSQHGCYFITNSGYIYNQSNNFLNTMSKKWTFTQNDVIKITVDLQDKKIFFQKQGNNLYQMLFQEKPNMELNFGILLCQKDDCVEIVQDFQKYNFSHT